MTISIEPLQGEFGVSIEDRIEQRQCELLTSDPVSPISVPTDRFEYPIDRAISIRTRELTVTGATSVYLRDEDGRIVADVEPFTEREFGHGTFFVEINAPVKFYVKVEGPGTLSLGAVEAFLRFEESTSILVGARSFHERPAATIETTSDPGDVMQAVSYLSSSLKTTTAERAFPTLRGHPPELALAEELHVPDELDVPETGVHVEVPPELGHVFVAAPLAFYLGAEVRPGSDSRIVTDTGWTHPLDTVDGFENEVERVLKQTFFLDCVVRTEGIYDVPLRERQVAEEVLDLDFGELYQASPADQLAAYLEIPFEEIAEMVPRWKLTAHVAPRADSIDAIPFLVDDLAVIRTPSPQEPATLSGQAEAIEEFTRDGLVRGTRSRSGSDSLETLPNIVEPEQTDSIEQAWVGDGVPLGSSKATVEAFRNRLARDENEGDVEIVVVCNDSEMLDEHDTASAMYQSRQELPFDVTLYDDLTTDRLRLVLESDIDFFHYIGHIEEDGFRCSDGLLDVSTLDEARLQTFFLNACSSYQQGMYLIERGAIGGVVTLDDVINSGAIRVGKAMTRLLSRGFPLRAALTIASERSIIGGQYIVVGDGNMDIAHSESLIPNLLDISETVDDHYSLRYRSYYSANYGIGALAWPRIRGNDVHYLVGSELADFTVSEDELAEFLNLEVVPVRIRGQISWSDRIDETEI